MDLPLAPRNAAAERAGGASLYLNREGFRIEVVQVSSERSMGEDTLSLQNNLHRKGEKFRLLCQTLEFP